MRLKTLPVINPQFLKLHEDFKGYIQMQGYRSGGPSKYHLWEFLHFIEQQGITDIVAVQTLHILMFREYLMERPNIRKEGGLSDGTIKDKLYVISLFFDYLLDAGVIQNGPAQLPVFKLNKYKERNIVTEAEIRKLYSVCETKRDRCLLSLAYGCGLRRGELLALNVEDIFLSKGFLIVRSGKGGKYRVVPFSQTIMRDFRDYLTEERDSYFLPHDERTTNAFLINNHGSRMRGNKAADRLGYLIEKTKSLSLMRKGITLHCLRHSISTHLLDNGAAIEFVQQFLGHASIDMSHHYAKRRKRKTAILKKIGG